MAKSGSSKILKSKEELDKEFDASAAEKSGLDKDYEASAAERARIKKESDDKAIAEMQEE